MKTLQIKRQSSGVGVCALSMVCLFINGMDKSLMSALNVKACCTEIGYGNTAQIKTV